MNFSRLAKEVKIKQNDEKQKADTIKKGKEVEQRYKLYKSMKRKKNQCLSNLNKQHMKNLGANKKVNTKNKEAKKSVLECASEANEGRLDYQMEMRPRHKSISSRKSSVASSNMQPQQTPLQAGGE